MERYDYREAMYKDIKEYIEENEEDLEHYDFEELVDHLCDVLWTCDSVTGNASGSYTFNTWKAEENLCHNWDLLEEAMDELGCDRNNAFERRAEYWDVTIRCYLLYDMIQKVVDDLYIDKENCNEERSV